MNRIALIPHKTPKQTNNYMPKMPTHTPIPQKNRKEQFFLPKTAVAF